MLEWLQSIGDFFISIGEFLVSFFTNVVEVVLLVFKAFVYVSQIIGFLPVQYQAIVLAFVSFSVIYAVIHFGG